MNTAAEAKGLDRMRIKANGPNWRGNGGFGLDASKRKFSRDGKLGGARMGQVMGHGHSEPDYLMFDGRYVRLLLLWV